MVSLSPIIMLPGAGGGVDEALFRTSVGDITPFEAVSYPGWWRYVEDGFSAESLIADLAAHIVTKIPTGPIHIAGSSIGGHLGYAAALLLQAQGREIGGFCAVDTFMMRSAAPSAEWAHRALALGLELLRKRRIGEFTSFLRSRFWRAFLRFAGDRLPPRMRKFAPSGRLPWVLAVDPIFEHELNMRLLIRVTAPCVASLDLNPVALIAPAILLRTRFTARDDSAWNLRCPGIRIIEIPGDHQSLFDPENVVSLRECFIAATQDWR